MRRMGTYNQVQRRIKVEYCQYCMYIQKKNTITITNNVYIFYIHYKLRARWCLKCLGMLINGVSKSNAPTCIVRERVNEESPC